MYIACGATQMFVHYDIYFIKFEFTNHQKKVDQKTLHSLSTLVVD